MTTALESTCTAIGFDDVQSGVRVIVVETPDVTGGANTINMSKLSPGIQTIGFATGITGSGTAVGVAWSGTGLTVDKAKAYTNSNQTIMVVSI